MNTNHLEPKAKILCEKCFNLSVEGGRKCPFMKWDKRFCEQIKKISLLEKELSTREEKIATFSAVDFSMLYKKYGEAIADLSLTNCFRNGPLPKNMPEVL